jgi:hypothetical protein
MSAFFWKKIGGRRGRSGGDAIAGSHHQNVFESMLIVYTSTQGVAAEDA